MADRDVAKPDIKMHVVCDCSTKTALNEVGIKIDDVEREGRIAGRIGFAPPIFDKQLTGSGAKASMGAVKVALKRCANGRAAGKLIVIALLPAGDNAKAPTFVRNTGDPADGVTVIDAAILTDEARLRVWCRAVGELYLYQLCVNGPGECRSLGNRRDAACNLDAVNEN